MMQAIKNKLKSRRGASLTFALLLFLVCAVLGSVVLAAGAATSGRLSQLPDYEQRYYAVTSAAELLRTQLCEGTVNIEKTKKEVKKTIKVSVVSRDEEGKVTGESVNESVILDNPVYTCSVKVEPDTLHSTTKGLLEALARKIVLNNVTDPAAVWDIKQAANRSFSFTISAGDSMPEVKVDAVYKHTDDGYAGNRNQLTLTLYNNEEGNQYRLKMVLNPEYQLVFPAEQLDPDQTETVETVENSGDTTTRTITETKLQYTSCFVSWKVADIVIEGGESGI